ncbi:hypothetical protein ONE63_000989 [Megalurothrips usitatus]|uniref:Phospholipid scramblase n=1 Tax=Megalurothrips usitatus TaxID=439358 RepID=A0AAV7Y431_9NEOP|nr:hypothetical protein ONE63_000989 [Megalurothrips usitatus]
MSYPPPQQPGYPPAGGYPQPGLAQPGYAPPGGQVYPQPGGYGQPMGFSGQQYPPPDGQAFPPPGGQAYPPPGGYAYPPPGGHAYPPPDGWMNLPQGVPMCPPGLEYLTLIDQLLVHQKVEILEALTGFETKNKFTVKNSMGQKVYKAVEDSDCLTRNCCGPLRPFDMKILDNFDNQVIHLYRPLACVSCCFPCCLQSMEVSSPPGNHIGKIEQEWSILTPKFVIKDHNDEVVLRIVGPMCPLSICGSDVKFKVLTKDGEHEVGKIYKQWSGILREALTDADHFGITFPMDLDVRMKAVMLGACFLIDAMYFEKTDNK